MVWNSVNLKADLDLNHIPVILLTARSASVYEIESIETEPMIILQSL